MLIYLFKKSSDNKIFKKATVIAILDVKHTIFMKDQPNSGMDVCVLFQGNPPSSLFRSNDNKLVPTDGWMTDK